MRDTTRSVMLAAGGTGGHLFPAYALAEEPRRLRACGRSRHRHARRPLRHRVSARAVYQVASATVAGKSPRRSPAPRCTCREVSPRPSRSSVVVRPKAVVGFGGYPTVPPLLAASLRAIPTALHEQNAVLGRANSVLAGRVSAIATSFERTRRLGGRARAQGAPDGNPVRAAVLAQAAEPYRPPTPDARFVLLVFGGSQARVISPRRSRPRSPSCRGRHARGSRSCNSAARST